MRSDDDLLDALFDDPGPVDGDGPEQWLADELDHADDVAALQAIADTWLRRLRAARRRVARIERRAQEEIDRITERRDDLTAGDRRTIDAVTAGLSEIHRRIIAQDQAAGRTVSASVKLIYGTLRSKLNHSKTKRKIVDRAAFEEWAKTNRPDRVTTELVPVSTIDPKLVDELGLDETRDALGNVTAAKILDPETGEQVPGVAGLPPERSFWIDDMGAD